jgi:prophage regulatory protein
MVPIQPDPATGAGISFLRLRAVCERTGLGKTSIHELQKVGRFPRGQHVAGTRNVVWPSHLIDAWVREQLASAEMAEA